MRPRFWNMALMKADSASARPPSSVASAPAIMARRNSSRICSAWARSCMCSSSTRLSAMVRTALKPTSVTARETVLTPPRLAWAKSGLFTRRSSLWVSATSLRISRVRSPTLSSSDMATRWIRMTVSESAGKSLLRRMRSSKKSSVGLPADSSARASALLVSGADAVSGMAGWWAWRVCNGATFAEACGAAFSQSSSLLARCRRCAGCGQCRRE